MQIEPEKMCPGNQMASGAMHIQKWMRCNQIMLACQQSGAVSPIMDTTVGATLARP